MPLSIQIITQERLVYESQEVDKVIAPTSTGEITILPNHAPLISLLDVGEIEIAFRGSDVFFAVTGGVIQIADNHVIVLARTAENASEIDIKRAQEARERARELMESGLPLDEDQYAAIEASLRRANIRLKVASHQSRLPRRGTGPGEMSFGGE